MKRLLAFIATLLISTHAYAAPPVRDNVYIPLTTIRSNDVMANEDAIFGYLQAGIDHIREDGLDRLIEIDDAIKSGSDGLLITGTPGAADDCAKWNSDGDIVSAGAACGSGSGGGSEWTDGGVYLYPTNDESVVVGETTPTSVIGTGNIGLSYTDMSQTTSGTTGVFYYIQRGGIPKPFFHIDYAEIGAGSATYLGIDSGRNFMIDASSNTTGVGYKTFYKAEDGEGNTAVGSFALEDMTEAYFNTAIGHNALTTLSNPSNGENTAVGAFSLNTLSTGEFNTAVGTYSMFDATVGSSNTGVGYGALANSTDANFNTTLGFEAGASITTGDENICIGMDSCDDGTASITGDNNVGVGSDTLSSLTSGTDNIAAGAFVLNALTTGRDNVGVGDNALQLAVDGIGNTGIGDHALTLLTSGDDNTAVGDLAGGDITTGNRNVCVGPSACDGSSAGIEGSDNVGIGFQTLGNLTDGVENVAIGNGAMPLATGAVQNVAIGVGAGGKITNGGDFNVMVGVSAGDDITTGNDNICIGDKACDGSGAITGNDNVAVGHNALVAVTSGANNIMLGQNSGLAITHGIDNAGIGRSACDSVTSGDNNVCIGLSSDISSPTLNNRIILGTSVHTVQVAGTLTLTNGAGTLECLHRDTVGVVSGTGSDCGSGAGSGSGTVSTGLVGRIAYYPSTGTTVDDTTALHLSGSDTIVVGDLTISGDDLTMGTNTSGFLLVADGTNYNPVAMSGDTTISSAGVVAIGANTVALGTDTTNAYVADIAATTDETTVSGGGAETATVTIGLPDNVEVDGTLAVHGTLTIQDQKGLRFQELPANGGNYIEFQPPATITSNVNCTLENDGNPIPDSCVGDGTDGNATLSRIGASTYLTVQHFANLDASTGQTSGGAITAAAGANQVDVAAGTGWIKATDSNVAEILFFDWAASAGVSVPSNTTRYIGVQYNAGTPVVVAKTTDSWDLDTEFPLGIVVNEGGTRYILNNPLITGDNMTNVIERFDSLATVSRDNRFGGLIISNSGTRNVAVTTGTLLARMSEFAVTAMDTSSSGSFDAYYRDGAGGWTKESAQTQWNNTSYDDGDGTLGSITALSYSSRWWYIMTDGSLAMLYGQDNTSTLATILSSATPPSSAPNRILKEGLLIGRFIIQASGSSPAVTQSAFGVSFTAAGVTNFSDLAGQVSDTQIADGAVDGGTGGEIADASITSADLATAVNSRYIILNPGAASITGTMAITADATQGAQIDGSNGFVLLFDATTDEGAAYRFRLPDNWVSHTDLKLTYSMVSGTANEVEWEAAVMCTSPGDSERDDADGFAAIATTVDTVPGTVLFEDTVTITLTDDSCAANDLMTINISTDSDDATNDDATGDRRLLGIIYEYSI